MRSTEPAAEPGTAEPVAASDASKADGGRDFSMDDYASIPPGTRRREQSGIIGRSGLDEIDSGDPELAGKPVDEQGYLDSQDRFIRQGRRTVWFDGDRRVKYREDLWFGGKRHGVQVNWPKDGTKSGEVPFVDGRLHGEVRHWHQDGLPSLSAWYRHGRQDGPRIEWYANGRKGFEASYADDQAHGPLRAWYEDGSPKEESQLSEGRYEGLARVWGPQSRKADELNYKAGKLHGVVIRHARDGRVLSKAAYRDGVLVAPSLDVRTVGIGEFLKLMEDGAVLTQKSRSTFRSIWREDAWSEMFGPPHQGAGTYRWSYTCLDGVLELTNRPVLEGDEQEGQIWVSVYGGSD